MDIKDIPIGERFYCFNEIKNTKCRAVREDADTVFVYAKGKKRYGYRLSNDDFLYHYQVIEPKDKTEEWHKRIRKAIRTIENSGIWSEHLEFLKNLLTMSWDDHEAMYGLYWQSKHEDDWDEWFEKYPFLKAVAANGDVYVDTNYLWEMSRVILKSMYFGKFANKRIKERIRTSVANKEDVLPIREQAGYDVSFSYNADKSRAWYSEEYRGCGNGHYYLALNENVAWFCEND